MYSIVAIVELYSDVNPEGKSNQRKKHFIRCLVKKEEKIMGKVLFEYDSCYCGNTDTQI